MFNDFFVFVFLCFNLQGDEMILKRPVYALS